MSAGTQTKVQKDVFTIDPNELVLDRDWNGRWTAVQDEPTASETAGKNALPTNEQAMVSIRELAASIKEHGQLEDILICKRPPDKDGNVYHVVAGQSRTRGALLLDQEEPGKHLIRCRLMNDVKTDRDAFLINEEENRQRNNLTLLDTAYCMKRERDLGLTLDAIATRWSRSVSAVNQALTLIESPEEVKQAVYDKIMAATIAIDTFKGLTPEAQIDIVNKAREAKNRGVTYKSREFRELARQATQADKTVAKEAQTSNGSEAADGTEAPANGATATTPVKPIKKAVGRPPKEKKVVRGLGDFKKVLDGRDGVISQTILAFLNGDPATDEAALISVLDQHEYEDSAPDLAPRTEGNPK